MSDPLPASNIGQGDLSAHMDAAPSAPPTPPPLPATLGHHRVTPQANGSQTPAATLGRQTIVDPSRANSQFQVANPKGERRRAVNLGSRPNIQWSKPDQKTHQVQQRSLIGSERLLSHEKAQIDQSIASAKAERKPVTTLSSQIETKAQQLKVQATVKRGLAAEAQMGQNTVQLKTLGGSANPVAHLKEDFFIPSNNVPARVPPKTQFASKEEAQEHIKTAVTDEMAKAVNTLGKGNADNPAVQSYRDTLNTVFTESLEEASGQNQSPKDYASSVLTNAIDKLEGNIGALERQVKHDPGKAAELQARKSFVVELKALQRDLEPTKLEHTNLYSKEQVLSNLRISNPLTTKIGGVQSRPADSAQLQAVRRLSGDYVSIDQLKQAGVDPASATRNIEPHASFLELMGRSGGRSEVSDDLSKRASLEIGPGYAVKAQERTVGNENKLEMLVQDLNDLTKRTSFLVRKSDNKLEGVNIVAGNQQVYAKPRTIASEWLAKGTDINKDNLQDLSDLKAKIAAQAFRGETPSEEDLARVNHLTDLACNETGSRSVIELAMMDLEINAGDNHPDQCKIVEGQTRIFDCSRFLPSGDVEVTQTPTGKTETFCLLKSAMLDHPHCQRTEIPKDIVDAFLARNVEQETQTLREHGMLGNPEFFKTATARFTEQSADFDRLAVQAKPSESFVRATAEKYGVRLPAEIPPGELQKHAGAVQKAIVTERVELKQACFGQVHPRGHELGQQRVLLMQEYLRTTEHPTVEGMKQFVLKDTLGPFMKVYQRMNGSPGLNMGIVHDFREHKGSRISLEEIITNAKERGLATPDEIQDMETALKRMQAERSCTRADLQTTTFSI